MVLIQQCDHLSMVTNTERHSFYSVFSHAPDDFLNQFPNDGHLDFLFLSFFFFLFFLFFFSFGPHHAACEILVPQPANEPGPLAVRVLTAGPPGNAHIFCCFDNSHANGCEVTFHCSFNFHFPNLQWC